MTGAEVTSLVAGIVSIVLAVFAIIQARDSRKEAQHAYEKTKDLLSQIDKRSAVTEERVAENFQKILDAVLDTFKRGRVNDLDSPLRGTRKVTDFTHSSGSPGILQAMEAAFDDALRAAVAEREDVVRFGEEDDADELARADSNHED